MCVCEALTCQEQPGCVGTTLHLWPVSRRASHHVVVDDLLEALAALFKAFLPFTKVTQRGRKQRENVNKWDCWRSLNMFSQIQEKSRF